MDFYDRVKDTCKAQGFNLREFLEGLGINYGTYKSCRRYKHLPRADDALHIAKSLGVTVEYLINGKNYHDTPLLSEIYNRLPGLTPQQLEAVLALVKGFSQ